MNYEKFATLYPWLDFGLELFKGIMPTIVALLAIYFNNKNATKREKEKIEHDIRMKSILNLQDDAINIDIMIYDVGTQLFFYFGLLGNDEKRKEYWSEYVNRMSETLQLSRKVLIKSNMETNKTGIEELSFKECHDKISKFCDETLDMIDDYDKTVKKSSLDERKKLAIDMENKLKVISDDVGDIISEYINRLSKIISVGK